MDKRQIYVTLFNGTSPPPLYLPPQAHVKVTAVVSEMLLSPISPPLGFCQTGSQMSASSLCCDHDPPFSPCTSPGSVEVEMKPCPVLGGEDIVITFQCACTTEAVPAQRCRLVTLKCNGENSRTAFA